MKNRMNPFLNHRPALLGLAALVGVAIASIPRASHGQGSPVPPEANVATSPSVKGPPIASRGVAPVNNAPGMSAYLSDLDAQPATPVQIAVNVGISFGAGGGNQDVYTVPAGKRLVIKHVALQSDLLTVGNAVRGTILMTSANEMFTHPLDIRQPAMTEYTLAVANHALLAFADAGTTVRISAALKNPQGSGDGTFSILRGTVSGYLVQVP